MDIKNLRVGNWVEIIQPNKEVYTTIQPSCFSVEIKKFYKPIPLNIEWLEFFGFKKNNMYWIDDTNIGFTFHKNGDIEWNQPKNIKYVHELQNLYFALTGKELAKV